jgi:predicted enzyme related to lactoylglutathione lyase
LRPAQASAHHTYCIVLRSPFRRDEESGSEHLLDRRRICALSAARHRIPHPVHVAHNVRVLIEFTLDCCDLDREAEFWQTAAGLRVEGRIADRYVAMRGHGVALTLQRVPEPKTVKNRLHLDLLVDDVEGELRRLESLGASRITAAARHEYGQTWFVLADPEGNEFCLARDPAS